MPNIDRSGTFTLGDHTVKRLGYGAMQLAGPHVFGPPRDRNEALAVLREAVASGVDHIDTSDFYGPHITNQLIREALHPYPDDLVIVTKIGSRRGEDGSWIPAFSPEELTRAVHDNLRNLGLDVLDVVNLRSSRSAGSLRFYLRSCPTSRSASAPRRCRSRSPGCFAARRGTGSSHEGEQAEAYQ